MSASLSASGNLIRNKRLPSNAAGRPNATDKIKNQRAPEAHDDAMGARPRATLPPSLREWANQGRAAGRPQKACFCLPNMFLLMNFDSHAPTAVVKAVAVAAAMAKNMKGAQNGFARSGRTRAPLATCSG